MIGIEAVRRMIGAMIADVMGETQHRLAAQGVETPEDVRAANRPIVQFSEGMIQDLARLRAFLFGRMYRHDRINVMRDRAARTIDDLFGRYMDQPSEMPEEWTVRALTGGVERRARSVCDYVAGMTDLFAFEEHRRLFGVVDEPDL